MTDDKSPNSGLKQVCGTHVKHGSHWTKFRVARMHAFEESLEESISCSFWLLAEFSSLQLKDQGPHFLAGCKLRATLSFWRSHDPWLMSPFLHVQGPVGSFPRQFFLTHSSSIFFYFLLLVIRLGAPR